MKKYFMIGEISKLYNIGVDSIRYYEELGIITPKRSEKGYRLYSVNDIWKLNVIRELRQLNFGMDEIKQYLTHHTLSSSEELLKDEENAIDNLMKYLKGLKDNVKTRLSNIEIAKNIDQGKIALKEFPERHCFSLRETYKTEEEMDILIKKLLNIDKSRFYVIGNNQIGTFMSLSDSGIVYNSVFIIDKKGKDVIPKGKYLSVYYKGDYSKSEKYAREMLDFAKKNNLTPLGEIMEILWVDIHTSENLDEHITELQIQVK